MPIPKPKKNEKPKDFISRCMSDDIMKKEYPTKTSKGKNQRYAVCMSQLNKNKRKPYKYIKKYSDYRQKK